MRQSDQQPLTLTREGEGKGSGGERSDASSPNPWLVPLGAFAIAVIVPVAMTLTSGDNVVCDSTNERFTSGAFIIATNTRADADQPAPSVCVTFPNWYRQDNVSTVEVTVGHVNYDHRATLRFEVESQVRSVAGDNESFVGGPNNGALLTIRSFGIRPGVDGFSTFGFENPEEESPTVREFSASMELSNLRDGVLYTAMLGGGVKHGLEPLWSRLHMALVPTIGLLALYFIIARLRHRFGPPKKAVVTLRTGETR